MWRRATPFPRWRTRPAKGAPLAPAGPAAGSARVFDLKRKGEFATISSRGGSWERSDANFAKALGEHPQNREKATAPP